MALYAIADLHLSLGIAKPMDIFGDRWSGYMEKIETNWRRVVSDDDYVVIPGDISWATYIEQAHDDFIFIESLPGKKLILKGNHDYWWTTLNKLNNYLGQNGISSVSFIQNNSFVMGKSVLCGTRGWKCPGDDEFGAEDKKLYNREIQRLELSLKSAADAGEGTIIVALHFPPFNSKKEPSDFIEVMKRYNAAICLYGHLHSEGFKNAVTGNIDGIEYKLVSADYLNFVPLKLL